MSIALKSMLHEMKETNPVVLEVIDKVIQGVCKQLQNVSIYRHSPSIASLKHSTMTGQRPNSTCSRIARHPFFDLHSVPRAALYETRASNHLPICSPQPIGQSSSSHSETSYHCHRVPHSVVYKRCLPGFIGTADRCSRRWSRGDGDR